MMRDITIGQYYPADSILHRLDPRVKFVSTLVYICLLYTSCRRRRGKHSAEDYPGR